ncbi:MAG: CDP-alcohol phosphatidyltransferase [Bryobacteraceae bacterium]|nr:MAG: CDP-alcohol phosphatidyltransferase [Bryobacteraceae bacterium]
MKRHLPNALTLVRIVLTPAVGFFLAADDLAAALPLLAVAAATDAADGFLARRWNAASPLGAYLDPIADKLLAATVYIGLAAAGRLPWWLAGLVLGRDALILGFAAWALGRTRIRKFPPSAWGKLSTVLQFSLGLACLLDAAAPSGWSRRAVEVLIPLTAAGTVWSGFHYGRLAIRRLRREAD